MEHEQLLQTEMEKQKLQELVASLKLRLETARVDNSTQSQRQSEERVREEMKQKQELNRLFQVNLCTVWIRINIAFICCWGHCC